ncbi:hypothetical protein NADFUDRAFT_42577 [Nadsonia fulvescens var. elongata DSM 6958]|uniref:FAR-17a/AIG1-like protein n=1 Tax=Nadsonia fulvescens var. elongata DSM 6958 TaxID=857566 RepID=A0A1E3PIQ0_9ASCO|nr:hypothetical protein NADFUDRAFT_42577 [Nadsonia fulvescens var. elongata DSM 6958]
MVNLKANIEKGDLFLSWEFGNEREYKKTPMKMKITQLAVHLAGLAIFSRSFYDLHFGILAATPMALSYGGHFQYLTILGLFVSFLTFALALIHDITGLVFFARFKNILSILITPVEFVITTLYWALKTADPKLLIDVENLVVLVPRSFDLSVHVAPVVLLVIDLLAFSPSWHHVSKRKAAGLYALASTVYWYWVHHTYGVNGFFPYPFLSLVTIWQRVGVFLVGGFVAFGSFCLLRVFQK